MPAISFLPFLQTVPVATRILTGLTVVLTLVAFALDTLVRENSPNPGTFGQEVPWLVLVPGWSWKYPWVFLSAGFVELSIIELIISAVSLPLACRYLERIWGFKETIRFCFLTIIGGNIIAFGFTWLLYLVLGVEDAWYGTPYHGQSGLQAGFLVAFTQLIPEHQIQLFGKLKIRVKTLPGLYILASNVLTIVLGSSPYMLIQFGFFVSWVYLRFFKLSEDGLSRGDRSETFAFQYWFPPPVRPYISKAANFVHKMAVRAKLVQQWDEPSTGGGSYAMLPGPGGARAEAERRRQVEALALKALDARLASGSPAPGAPSPAAATTSAPPPAPVRSVSTGAKEEVKEAKEAKE